MHCTFSRSPEQYFFILENPCGNRERANCTTCNKLFSVAEIFSEFSATFFCFVLNCINRYQQDYLWSTKKKLFLLSRPCALFFFCAPPTPPYFFLSPFEYLKTVSSFKLQFAVNFTFIHTFATIEIYLSVEI